MDWLTVVTSNGRLRCVTLCSTLHTAAEPAVRAAVKGRSHGNDTIIAFFFEANKNKDNAIIALASSNN